MADVLRVVQERRHTVQPGSSLQNAGRRQRWRRRLADTSTRAWGDQAAQLYNGCGHEVSTWFLRCSGGITECLQRVAGDCCCSKQDGGAEPGEGPQPVVRSRGTAQADAASCESSRQRRPRGHCRIQRPLAAQAADQAEQARLRHANTAQGRQRDGAGETRPLASLSQVDRSSSIAGELHLQENRRHKPMWA